MSGFYARIRALVLAFIEDDCTTQSAALAFFGLSSLFPALLLLLSILSVFYGETARDYLQVVMRTYIPIQSLREYVADNFQSTLQLKGTMGIIGGVTLLWASKAVFLALERGLARAWRIPVRPATWWLYTKSIGFVMLMGLVMSVQFFLLALTKTLSAYDVQLLGFSSQRLHISAVVFQWVISPLMMFLVLTVIYKVLPSRRIGWHHVLPGAIFAASAWKIVEFGFIMYTTHIGITSALYGVVSILLALMLWCYLSAIIFFLGAEFIRLRLEAEQLVEHQGDSPQGGAKPPA